MRWFATLLTLMVLTASTAYATDRYVDDTGDDAANDCTNVANPCATIQHAIDEAADGDVIHIADGNYSHTTGLTDFKSNLTLEGNSEGSVILDFTGVSGYGIDAKNVDNLIFRNLTAQNGGHYGFKIYEVDGVELEDVTAQGFARSEIDLNNVTNATLTNITANGNGTSGVGIAFSGVQGATLTNITTAGNNWGSVGLYTTHVDPIHGISNVTITGTNSFAEAIKVYEDAEYEGTINNLKLGGFDYDVENPAHRPRGDDFVYYQLTQSDAIDFALSLPNPDSSYIQTLGTDGSGYTVVEDDYVVGTSGGTAMSIQAAIDAAGSSDSGEVIALKSAAVASSHGPTVFLLPGVYEQQVVIPVDDLTLGGSGNGSNPASNSIIRAPENMSWSFTTGSNDNYPIVGIDNAMGVTVENLRVDGAGRGNSNARFQGIGFWNGDGTVDEVYITGVRNTPFSGAQHGVAIYANNDTGNSYLLEVGNSTIDDFQKNGMALVGDGLSVNVHDNMVTGAGSTEVTAQNGIQVSSGASGSITGNTITGIAYTKSSDPAWAASAILPMFASGVVTVSNNDVSTSQVGLYAYNNSADVTGNTFSDIAMAPNGSWGVILDPNGDAVLPKPSPFDALGDVSMRSQISAKQAGIAATFDFTFDGNTVQGTDAPGSVGLEIYSAGETITATGQNNLIRDFETGIAIGEANSGDVESVALNQNCILSNTGNGLYNAAATGIDAENNWWGGPAGPDADDVATASGAGAVDTDPFATEPIAGVAGCGSFNEVVVTPSDEKGWSEQSASGGGSATITGDVPRNGSGSLRLTGDRIRYVQTLNTPVPLADVTAFWFDYYVDAVSVNPYNPDYTPAFRLHIAWDDNGTTKSGELIWEGAYNGVYGSLSRDTWYSVDASSGETFWRWVYGDGFDSGNGYDKTLPDWVTIEPTVQVYAISAGVGSGASPAYLSYVDNIALGVDAATTLYNFEPEGVAGECSDPETEPSYAGGFERDDDNQRYLLNIEAQTGLTEVVVYNRSNMNVLGLIDPDTGSDLTNYDMSTSNDSVYFTYDGTGPMATEAAVTYRREDTGVATVRFFLRMTDSCGRSIDVDPVFELNAKDAVVPAEFALEGNFPNPFSRSTSIEFSLPEATDVRLVVYDVMGRKVASLVDQAMGAGTHSVEWNGTALNGQQLANGTYLYRIESDAFTTTRRLVLLR